MRYKTLKFWLLVVLSFVLTMPGAVAFANWDAPYGFYKDLSVWMSCASSALLLVLIYGAYEWRKGLTSLKSLVPVVLIWVASVLVGLIAEEKICGQVGYQCGLLSFIVAGFLGLLLSLMLLPFALPEILAGGPYSYDRPLVIAWYLLLAVAILLSVTLYKQKKREKTHGTG